MLVPKFGIISHTAFNVIYGHSVVFCMKCAHSNHLSRVRTWMLYFKKFKNANMKKYLKDIHHSWKKSFQCV